MAVDEQTIMVSLLNLNANLGLLLIEIEEIIKNLKNVLKK
jgi:predicted regulator of Ras-like GTPase activity (Roadblock/LC7/MglB family)